MAIMSTSACQVTCHSLSYCIVVRLNMGSYYVMRFVTKLGSFAMQFLLKLVRYHTCCKFIFSFFTMPKAMKAMKVMKAAKKAAALAPTKKAMKAISLSHIFRPIAFCFKLLFNPLHVMLHLFCSVLLLWQQYIYVVHTCCVLL